MPSPRERDRCLLFLTRELEILDQARVLLCLGGFAWDGALRALAPLGHRPARRPKFGHGAEAALGPYTLVGCYHPSQQNTFTGRLTEKMLDKVLERCSALAGAHGS
jgi:uracil-DNA glycosylase